MHHPSHLQMRGGGGFQSFTPMTAAMSQNKALLTALTCTTTMLALTQTSTVMPAPTQWHWGEREMAGKGRRWAWLSAQALKMHQVCFFSTIIITYRSWTQHHTYTQSTHNTPSTTTTNNRVFQSWPTRPSTQPSTPVTWSPNFKFPISKLGSWGRSWGSKLGFLKSASWGRFQLAPTPCLNFDLNLVPQFTTLKF